SQALCRPPGWASHTIPLYNEEGGAHPARLEATRRGDPGRDERTGGDAADEDGYVAEPVVGAPRHGQLVVARLDDLTPRASPRTGGGSCAAPWAAGHGTPVAPAATCRRAVSIDPTRARSRSYSWTIVSTG